jgi:uroporphyrinogen-III decarboxylase
MEDAMNPTERVISAIDGREPDRLPTFSYYLDYGPVQQVIGKKLIGKSFFMLNPVTGFIMNRWGKHLSGVMLYPLLDIMMTQNVKAAAMLGFDSVVGLFERMFMLWDGTTMARVTGSFYDIVDDGHGNTWYMYRGPAFKTKQDYEAWSHFPDLDDLAQQTYRFFTRLVKKYGDRICILGQAAFGIHETMLWSFGFERMPVFIRKEPEMIRRFVAYLEELIMKTNMAMMDAGVKVIFDGDDMAFKTGPLMSPKLAGELFGPSYRRITKAVHDRGGRILLHSCGDNTMMFDSFIEWGFDGGHAYENTSNVDIYNEKKIHGNRFTIVGGVGVDYLLTARSTPEEVVVETKKLIQECGPGGRFLIGPVHDHPDMDMSKVKVMLETVWEHGTYPIKVG